MSDVQELTCGPARKGALWVLAGVGAVAVGLAVLRLVVHGPDPWLGVGLLFGLMGFVSFYASVSVVRADAYGVHTRTLLRRRSVPWRDIADLRVRRLWGGEYDDPRLVTMVLRDGRKRSLPVLRSAWSDDPDFDAKVEALRALHRRYGTPESDHLRVVSYRTAGRGWVRALVLCVVTLACACAAVWFLPGVASEEQAWKSAVPCAAQTPATERSECLATLPAVIARAEANPDNRRSWLYFTGDRPLERLEVPRETAKEFKAGQNVELTVWHHRVTEVAGDGYIWREHMEGTGGLATGAVLFVLLAGGPGAWVLQRLRGRRLPDDDLLPSAAPFMGALGVTAVWLLPLSYLHPTTMLSSPLTITWTSAGSAVTLGLLVWAWRATRVRVPGQGAGVPGDGKEKKGDDADEEVFLAACFLEPTDYNPYLFGTHIVLGGDSPAVTPHPGPGRFAAKRIPVERFTINEVRRARGGDGDTVPGNWHVAEIDDAGTPVRLAAAPKDLARIIRELNAAKAACAGNAAR